MNALFAMRCSDRKSTWTFPRSSLAATTPSCIPVTVRQTRQRTKCVLFVLWNLRKAKYISTGAAAPGAKRYRSSEREGFDVWGFETNAPTSSPYIVTGRDQILAKFDGIFSNNVIEHFRDPQRQFKEFHNILKPGGIMAHSSPCYKYAYAFTRFHTLFLFGRSADVLAERTGFRVTQRIENGEYINLVFAAVD